MSSTIHPLWLVGFRPFFALACLSGMLLPIAWALMFSGTLPAPEAPFPSKHDAQKIDERGLARVVGTSENGCSILKLDVLCFESEFCLYAA